MYSFGKTNSMCHIWKTIYNRMYKLIYNRMYYESEKLDVNHALMRGSS